MKFDLNNLITIEDYTNASHYFIRCYDYSLLSDDEAISLVIYAIYRAKCKLDKTKSDNRFCYTKKCVNNALSRYRYKNRYMPRIPYRDVETPLNILIRKEHEDDILLFIGGLKNTEKKCAEFLVEGVKPCDMAVKLNVSRSAVTYAIQNIKQKWLEYVEKKKTGKC